VTPQAFACRACGETAVDPVLSLGELPLVNELVDRDADKVDRFPLDVVRCTRCTLVQITETVPPERLFRTYSYFSSFSDTYVAHMRALADWAVADLGLGPKSLVVEAASNDGCLLRELRGRGIAVLGIEPARNVAEAARAAGIETLSEFLDVELARSIVAERGNASLVVANNVLAHVPDANGFVAALALLAGSAGHVVIEVPYLRDLVDAVEFDTIYHEHLSYFSLTSLQLLLARHGLVVRRVERIQVHGGSLRIHAAAFGDAEDSVAELLAEEAAWGVDDSRRFARFATDVEALRRDVYALVTGVVGSGATVAAYGAAAKGVVLANACGLDASLIRFVVDRNPHKQGRLLPGVGIPVRAPEALLAERPDYCVLFAWNLADEIAEQQAAYVEAGGSFIKPIPTPRVLAA
jgi:C-methyltransferase C-terminal domain/Putative zinc binding domain/Methyltransferase domain